MVPCWNLNLINNVEDNIVFLEGHWKLITQAIWKIGSFKIPFEKRRFKFDAERFVCIQCVKEEEMYNVHVSHWLINRTFYRVSFSFYLFFEEAKTWVLYGIVSQIGSLHSACMCMYCVGLKISFLNIQWRFGG